VNERRCQGPDRIEHDRRRDRIGHVAAPQTRAGLGVECARRRFGKVEAKRRDRSRALDRRAQVRGGSARGARREDVDDRGDDAVHQHVQACPVAQAGDVGRIEGLAQRALQICGERRGSIVEERARFGRAGGERVPLGSGGEIDGVQFGNDLAPAFA